MVKTPWLESALDTCDPEVAVEEMPGPETEQLVVFEELQVMVEVCPVITRVGSALIDTVGIVRVEAAFTVAVTGAEVPPTPVHVTLYVCVPSVSAPVETVPKVAPPVLNPVPVHSVAFVELQESVEESPTSTMRGFAEREAVGVRLQVGGLFAPFAQGS